MQSETFVDCAAAIAAVAAVTGLLYARASARAARDASDAARRSMELAERARQAAARARLRSRVERVGELLQDIAASQVAATDADELSTKDKNQCRILNRALGGLKDILPRSANVCRARSATELRSRAGSASTEVDDMLKKLTAHRPQSAYRPRNQVPWSRPAGARSGLSSGARGRTQVTRPPSP